jgi:hypothetical protein
MIELYHVNYVMCYMLVLFDRTFIGRKEFGNLIMLGSKPLPTAKAEVWACKILPGL